MSSFSKPWTACVCGWGLLVASMGFAPSALAEKLDRGLRLNGREVLKTLDAPYAQVRDCVVELWAQDEIIGLGTVWTSDGWIVAKASEFEEGLEVRLPAHEGRRYLPQEVVVDEVNDLGFMKIQAQGLSHVRWRIPGEQDRARIVFAPYDRVEAVRIGIVSTDPYEVPPRPGVLGVILPRGEQDVEGVVIEEVAEQSAAASAGLMPGDRILQVDGQAVRHSEQVVSAIQRHAPGEAVGLRLQRGGDVFQQSVVLGDYNWWDLNQVISGEFSKRRSGFERVIQHDVPVPPRGMGAPLFDLSAQALGINIARVDRLTTLALPADLVQASFLRARGLSADPAPGPEAASE